MHVHNRPFDPDHKDFEKMWRFLQQDYAQRQAQFVWLISRLGDWKFGLWNEKKYIPSFFRNHAQLWVDRFDQLLGFVVSEDGGNLFFIFTRHGYDYLYVQILDWTIQHWGSRFPELVTEVHEYQDEALGELARQGFRSTGVVAITREYDLLAKEKEAVRLPAEYRIVDMHENGDYRSKSLLYVNGFENRDQIGEFDLLRFEYSRENPAYDPRFDLSVVTLEGVHVAGCVGFHDPAHGVAEVEKICTHNRYRRQGLAEAVVRACFHRLRGRGIERAFITGYSTEANGLYEKLGPCRRKQWFHYISSTASNAARLA
jgi:ribosomal protein S18 acetylase RimI-like enzyme